MGHSLHALHQWVISVYSSVRRPSAAAAAGGDIIVEALSEHSSVGALCNTPHWWHSNNDITH